MTTHNPLPDLGLCPACEGEIRIRKSGALYAHGCCGDGRQPVARLEPTFARWLHAQAPRRDYYENRITALAQRVFRCCPRIPNRTPAEVRWSTAEELHDHEHRVQLQWTGSDVRQPYDGQRCDWLCGDIQHAAEMYARLLVIQHLDARET
ncbi:hypothetical protein [Streptomyces sp. URMC 124]|uniref:hypothetical protein n=1 Tax=Streptomyces sp. URMC 124 TaxID=3423405 RepID=UPI003F1C1910